MEHFDLTHPQRLLWLLLVPLLWWLARPVRPRRMLVSAHMAQWIAARDALRRRRVRFDWLRLLLLCLALGAAVLAFTRPRWAAQPGPRSLAVILDATASMAARPSADAPSAWERAVRVVRDELARAPRELAVRWVRVDDQVSVGSVGRSGSGARSVEDAWLRRPPGGAGRLAADLVVDRLMAEAGEDDLAVWTVTDGRSPFAVPAAGSLTVVGGPAANVGIVGCVIDDGWPLPDITVIVEVGNFGEAPVRCAVRFASVAAGGGNRAAELREEVPAALAVPAGAIERVVIRLRRLAGGAARVRLVSTETEADSDLPSANNALLEDDVVEFRLPAPAEPNIAVLTDAEGGLALRAAAAALAAEVGGQVVEDRDRAGFLLVDGGRLGRASGTVRMMSFGTRPAAAGTLTRAEWVRAPRVVDWERTEPLLAGLDLSELRVAAALRTGFLGTTGERARRVLARAEHGPLMVFEEFADDAAGGGAVHCGFRLEDSNLPMLAAFPQLLRRAYARSYGQAAEPQMEPAALLDRQESDLRQPLRVPSDRVLPGWGATGTELAPWCMLLALLLLVVRLYV